jgi:hypothetical protein
VNLLKFHNGLSRTFMKIARNQRFRCSRAADRRSIAFSQELREQRFTIIAALLSGSIFRIELQNAALRRSTATILCYARLHLVA